MPSNSIVNLGRISFIRNNTCILHDISGLRIGDILVRMDNVEIDNVRDLIKVMNKRKVGDRVAMELFRGSEKISLKTVLQKAPSAMPKKR